MDKKIYSGADRARELGFDSYRAWLKHMAGMVGHRFEGRQWDDSAAVFARVDFGRWLADCEAGHASYVDPHDQLFFCYVCANAPTAGKYRRVIFPDDWQAIEAELLRRPVKLAVQLPPELMSQGTQVAMNSRGANNPMLGRSWIPGESLNDLIEQREALT